jgi:hypothetical protein
MNVFLHFAYMHIKIFFYIEMKVTILLQYNTVCFQDYFKIDDNNKRKITKMLPKKKKKKKNPDQVPCCTLR